MASSEFDLALTWNDGFKGAGQIKGANFGVQIGIPQSYGGSGAGANPKELLASSAAACFIATLTSILENRKTPVAELAVATHVLETDEGISITHEVDLKVVPGSTEEDTSTVQASVERADKVCAVGNILRKAGTQIEARLRSIEEAK